MENQKFSVLMSVYNKENPRFLRESLDSILNQSIVPDEVVLVKDGKLTRALNEVIIFFESKYKNIIKVVSFENNRGLGVSLHDGILECSNEIVFRMDSDDICVKDRFEKTMKIFNSMDVDVVGGIITEYDENMEQIMGIRVVPEKNEDITKLMKKRNAINHVTVAYKKSKVLEAGNYQDMPFFEDYYLWVRMILKGFKFYNIQENLVNVRGGTSMIERRGGTNYISKIVSFEKNIYNIKFISLSTCFLNILERAFVSIIPRGFRTFVYKKILRK